MHVDEKDDVTWTCEAFGIPDVRYEWLKNGKTMIANSSKMAVEDRDRYEIRDNILIIRSVSFDSCLNWSCPGLPKNFQKKNCRMSLRLTIGAAMRKMDSGLKMLIKSF